jgi:hypothetical protein
MPISSGDEGANGNGQSDEEKDEPSEARVKDLEEISGNAFVF